MAPPRGEVSRLLAELKPGDSDALARLIPLIYDELHGLAQHYMRGERIGHTLQPTALINEAYLRLARQNRTGWHDRSQFIGVAAQMMRRILVDHARARGTGKRGGRQPIQGLEYSLSELRLDEILTIDEALGRLCELDPQQGRVVELRYFGGLTVEETAEALGVSPRTVKRDWAMAAAWLRTQLSSPVAHDP